jgi:hypothetical protein
MQNKTNVQTQPRAFSSTAISIPELRTIFNDRVIAPDDPGYDKARTVVAGGIDRRPAVIIRVNDANEVARVVSLARESGMGSRSVAAVTAVLVTVFARRHCADLRTWSASMSKDGLPGRRPG